MFIAIVIVVGINIVIANRLDSKHKGAFPDSLPFRWFYYFGLSMGELSALGFVVYGMSVIFSDQMEAKLISLVCALIFGGLLFSCYQYFKMKKWAFVVLSVCSGNILVWIAHPFYYSKRKQFLA